MKKQKNHFLSGFDFDEFSVRLFISTGLLMIALFLGILVLKR